MADYYPLIARAVAGLQKNSGENRRAVYDRARTALLTQLRGIVPPLPESDITRERLALEESIRKVEAESARQYAETSRQSRLRAANPSRRAPRFHPRFRANEKNRCDQPSGLSSPRRPAKCAPAFPMPIANRRSCSTRACLKSDSFLWRRFPKLLE